MAPTAEAQGVTCDHVLVVGPAGLYREGAYVALSRARTTTRLYTVGDDPDDEHRTHARTPAMDLVTRALTSSRAEQSIRELAGQTQAGNKPEPCVLMDIAD